MKITEIRTTSEFRDLSGVWDGLLGERGEEVLMSTFEWSFGWWSHFGEDKALRVLVAEDGNDVVGIAPLYAHTVYSKSLVPVRVRSFLGHELFDYGCFLTRHDRTTVCSEFLRHLARKRDWHELRLHNIPQVTGDFERLGREATHLGYLVDPSNCESSRVFYVRTEGEFSDYLTTRGRNLRHDVEKRQRRLSEMGGFEVKFTGEVPFPAFLEAIATVHTKRQAELGRESMFQREAEGAFARQMLASYNQRGWLDYTVMIIDGSIAAYRAGFRYRGVLYDWNTAFDPKYNAFSIGKVLLFLWIKHSFQRTDVQEFNFMRGESDYKEKFATGFWWNHHFVARHPGSLYARGVTVAERVWRATGKRWFGAERQKPRE